MFGVKVFPPIKAMAKCYGKHFPESIVRLRYFLRFRKFLNLKHPKNLNEKILFLSLKTDTSEWTRLADKYRVRQYITDCGLGYTLTELYAYWKDMSDVDFSVLPSSFVIKSVQGCGDVIVVRDKSKVDFEQIKRKLIPMFTERYGALEGGKHYLRIEPAVIVEELLPSSGEHLIDYKIWCFNGKSNCILTCSGRSAEGVHLGLYDLEWNYMKECMAFSKEYSEERVPLPKPDNLQEMLLVAERLAKPFPCVRVDLYNIQGKIYFGEMTFTSLGGMMNYFTEDCLLKMGNEIDLNYNGE